MRAATCRNRSCSLSIPFMKITRTRVNASTSSLLYGLPASSRQVKACLSSVKPRSFLRSRDTDASSSPHGLRRGEEVTYAVAKPARPSFGAPSPLRSVRVSSSGRARLTSNLELQDRASVAGLYSVAAFWYIEREGDPVTAPRPSIDRSLRCEHPSASFEAFGRRPAKGGSARCAALGCPDLLDHCPRVAVGAAGGRSRGRPRDAAAGPGAGLARNHESPGGS